MSILFESPPFGVDLTESHGVWPDEFKRAVLRKVEQLDWARYPARQQRDILERVAAHHLIDPRELVLTRGATEGLRLCFQLLKNVSRGVLLPAPGFFGFNLAAAALGMSTQDYDVWQGFAENVQDGSDHVPVLCSPNNPTGHLIDIATVERICRRGLPPFGAIVDLTYDGFTDHPLQHHLRRLVDLGAMSCLTVSKTYALAGARVGLLAGPATVIEEINRAQDRFPLDYFQLAVIDTLYTPEWAGHRQEMIDNTRALRSRVFRLLSGIFSAGDVLTATANFVCVRYGTDVDERFLREIVGATACKWFAGERLLRFTVNPRTAQGLSEMRAGTTCD